MTRQPVRPDRSEEICFKAAGGLLTVDLDAVAANYRWLSARAAPARCAGVVKADGYGLGAARVAGALHAAGCRDFFVAHLGEALDLRPSLPAGTPIYILNGLLPGCEAACAAAGLVPVLNGLAQVAAWAETAAAVGRPLPAALQVDSGMSRLGLAPEEVDALAARPDWLARLDLKLVMSHLACADEPDHPANAAQRDAFETRRGRLPAAPLSLSNSGGILLPASFHHDLARPGIALYGVSPTPGRGEGIRPVMRLEARVIQTRHVPAGAVIGYGASATAAMPMRLATIAVGYADGWPRLLGNRGAAFFGGTRLPIVGRVSMDSIILDIGALPPDTLARGSLVELIGPHQSLDEVAAQCGTIPYEILTSLGHRYARRYRGGTATPADEGPGP